MNLRRVYRRTTHGWTSLGQGVLVGAIVLALWRGGYFPPARYAFAALAAVGIPAALGRRPRLDWVLAGLMLMAAANLAAAGYWHRWSTLAPAAAMAALPIMYLIAQRVPGER